MERTIQGGVVQALAALFVLATAACGGGPGPDCHYSLSTRGQGLPANGGDVEVKVEAPAGCTWVYQGDDPWVSVHSAPPPPSGDGTVVATVAANAGVRRVGTATIAYQRVTFDQAGSDGAGSCAFKLLPLAATIGPAGGFGGFAVVPNAPDCSWWVEARTPDDDWIDGDFHRGIGVGVSTYQVAPGSVLPSVTLPRTGRLGLYNSANALVADHLITETP